MLNLAALADTMRLASGRWIMLDDDGYRGTLSSRATSWKKRPPTAFASGCFEFRVRRNIEDANRFILWGRHMPRAIPIDPPSRSPLDS